MIIPKDVESGISFGITTLVITCHMCREDKVIELSNEEYENYFVKGQHTQVAMKNQPADIRELCISGTCGKCFDEMFKEEGDE
jgi:hypothetical protein